MIPQIVVCALTLMALIWDDIVETKKPFDESRRKFSFYKHWWRKKWDDVGKWVFLGALGGIGLAGEVGYYLIQKIVGLNNIAEIGLNLTLVAFCTAIFARPKRLFQLFTQFK